MRFLFLLVVLVLGGLVLLASFLVDKQTLRVRTGPNPTKLSRLPYGRAPVRQRKTNTRSPPDIKLYKLPFQSSPSDSSRRSHIPAIRGHRLVCT